MILDEWVTTGLSPTNIHHYESLGYEIPKKMDSKGRSNYTKGTKITVRVSDLPASSNIKVRCQCEMCGEIRYVNYSTIVYRKDSFYLKDGTTLCLKCRNSLYKGKSNPQYKHGCNRYCEYRTNAHRRGIEFHLTVDEFKSIIEQPCHYCGGFSSDYDTRSRGNGIDRKDSSIGYETFNCVPCCSRCNFIKHTMPYDEFRDYIKRVYRRMFENEDKE